MYYKRYGELNSLEGKNNKTGIRFKEDMLYWNGLKIPVMIDYNNDYEYHAEISNIPDSSVLPRPHKFSALPTVC